MAANAFDILMDIFLTIVLTSIPYLGLFFLKQILDSLDTTLETRVDRLPRAYIYAILTFVCTLVKVRLCTAAHHRACPYFFQQAQVTCQARYIAVRASFRARSELMAAIYDKALKRKDFSAVAQRDSSGNAAPNAAASTGKIVNMMAADASRVCIVRLRFSVPCST